MRQPVIQQKAKRTIDCDRRGSLTISSSKQINELISPNWTIGPCQNIKRALTGRREYYFSRLAWHGGAHMSYPAEYVTLRREKNELLINSFSGKIQKLALLSQVPIVPRARKRLTRAIDDPPKKRD